ncbi:MAG: Uma2 family endonuclease [Planctomycetota bacterium]
MEIPRDIHSLAGFRRWVEGLGEDSGLQATYASGEVFVDVSPQSYRTHGPLVAAINRVLLGLAAAEGLGQYHLPPSWITCGEAISTEPDGFLIRWDRLRSGEVRVNPANEAELLGCPDMTLEVVSRSSARKDTDVLVRDYARAGVAEYWLADARQDRLSLQLLVLRAGAYVAQPPDPEGWLASEVWGREFRLRRSLDPAGQSGFELEVRAIAQA